MKKFFAIVSIIALTSTMLASCSSSNEAQITTSTDDSYNAHDNEYIIDTTEVTNENGEVVTDASGQPVTEQVLVRVTNTNDGLDSNEYDDVIELGDLSPTSRPSGPTTTVPSANNPTEPDITTVEANKDIVPSTSETGKTIDFSASDQQIIKQMLEVPYLYEASYENTDEVPIKLASHVAIWQAQRKGASTNSYPETDVVLHFLFKYFGRTVVNYSSRCNSESSNQNIIYTSEKDNTGKEINKMFIITKLESPTHTISIDHIEDLGNNNYYKVVANVSGVDGITSVNAVIQRNKLDPSLGFSVKALKWA